MNKSHAVVYTYAFTTHTRDSASIYLSCHPPQDTAELTNILNMYTHANTF